MRMLVAGSTQSQIAGSLNLSAKTVNTYRNRILEKLRLTTTAELIRYALANKIE
jgi:two-component system, NarL family, invasion response regulator UvrY